MKRRYGRWPGNPTGRPEIPGRCVVEVDATTGWIGGQCSRPRGHGKDELFCKQHAKMHERGRYLYIPGDK